MLKQDPKTPEFQQVSIVEASAGSGKTYCLAKRYVQLLIDPKLCFSQLPFENVLAITFSNKAALEMKERILEFLKKIALDKFSSPAQRDDILSSLNVDRQTARQRAHEIMDKLLRNYNFFQVQTIDSFINAVLCGCAYQLGLSANFKIERDYKGHLVYSLDRLIDRAVSDKKILGILYQFIAQYLYVDNKTSWLPKEDMIGIMVDLFSSSNMYGGLFLRSHAGAKELLAQKRAVLDEMRSLRESLPQGTHATFEKSLSAFLAAANDTFQTGDISDFFGREEFPLTKKGTKSIQAERLWMQIRRDLSRLCEDESTAVFGAYIDIFYEMLKELWVLSAKEDVLFLEELNSKAKMLFEDGTLTVDELYYRMATRIKHFLIDEFQDTSRLQWSNLFLMIEEALSTGGSLFYVGDKKQAIYRFRGGDAGLFDAVRMQFSAFGIVSTVLNDNYRSRKEIVDFCNEIFSQENLKCFLSDCADAKKKSTAAYGAWQEGVLDVFKSGKQNYVPGLEGGYVQVEEIDCANKDEKNERTKERFLGLIDDLRMRFDDADIAVLARENDSVELLTQWLLEHGIPVESEKTLNIRNNPLIKEIVSFFRFLNSPIDDIAFASFIMGDIFVKASGCDVCRLRDFIFSAREKLSRCKTYLYREFRLEFGQAWEDFIEEFFKNVGFIPVYELTVSVYTKFRCLEHFSQYQGFFMKLLELIKDEEEAGFNLGQFLDYFDLAPQESLYVKVAEMDSVKVLTMHKAKGLGFGAVVVPFLEMNVKTDSQIVGLSEEGLILRRINEKHRVFSSSLRELFMQEYAKSFIDELNSIYVALTRAKNELYCFVPKTARRGVNLAGLLMPQGGTRKGVRGDYRKKTRNVLSASTFELAASRHQDWVRYLKEEFGDVEALKNWRKLLRGDAAHSVLAAIGRCRQDNWRSVLDVALQQARPRFPGIDCWDELERVISSLLTDERFKPFFFDDEAEVYREKEVIDQNGRLKRIDRLVVGPERVWVVDFKSSSDLLGRGREQVEEYVRILTSIYPGKDTRGVLIYLDDLRMDEVYG